MSLTTATLPERGPAVNGTRLVALELNERETWFTLTCAVCGRPIAPPESGNLVWDIPNDDGAPLEPFKDAGKVALLDVPVHAIHKGCDPEDRLGRCWTSLDAVLSLDQNQFDRFRHDVEWDEFQEWKQQREKRARSRLMREFRALTKAEPRLAELFKQAKAVRDNPKASSFCANQTWGDKLRPRLEELVGWEREGDPVLGTSRAYDVAFEAVYQVLPACRNCACL